MKYLLMIFLSINVFALDLTFDTDSTNDTSIGESTSNSKDQSIDNTKKKEDTKTKSNEKSFVKSRKIDYDGKINALAYLAGLEKAEVSPFAECRLLTKPHKVESFDLGCEIEYGVSKERCTNLDSAAKSQSAISSLDVDEEVEGEIKGYANCGLLYGAIIAQYLKTGLLNVEIKDKKILNSMNDIALEIDNAECYLNDTTTNIMCDSVSLDISRTLKLTANSYEIFGGNEYFGFKLNISKDKNKKSSISNAFTKSKARSDSNKIAKGIKYDQSNNYKLSQKAAANLSVGKFVSE